MSERSSGGSGRRQQGCRRPLPSSFRSSTKGRHAIFPRPPGRWQQSNTARAAGCGAQGPQAQRLQLRQNPRLRPWGHGLLMLENLRNEHRVPPRGAKTFACFSQLIAARSGKSSGLAPLETTAVRGRATGLPPTVRG